MEINASGDEVVSHYYYRSAEQQNILFKAGLTKCDGYINRSRHQDMTAADLYLATEQGIQWVWNEEKAIKYHKIWEEQYGGKPIIMWDLGHFEG
jgi:hypothetical protein